MIPPWNFPMAIPLMEAAAPRLVCGTPASSKPAQILRFPLSNLVRHIGRRRPAQGRDQYRHRLWPSVAAHHRASRRPRDFAELAQPPSAGLSALLPPKVLSIVRWSWAAKIHDRARRRQPRPRHRRRPVGRFGHHGATLYRNQPHQNRAKRCLQRISCTATWIAPSAYVSAMA